MTLCFMCVFVAFKGLHMDDQIKLVQDNTYPLALLLGSKYYDLLTHDFRFFLHNREESSKVVLWCDVDLFQL